MAVALAVVEAVVLWTAMVLGLALWGSEPVLGVRDLGLVIVPTLSIAVLCAVSFYYHDLYDLRVTRSFTEFAPRMIQALGVSFVLTAAVFSLFPEIGVGGRPFYSSMLMTVAIVVPLRAATYAVMRTRAYRERVLIVGRGRLARAIAQAIAANPNCGYSLTGFVDDGAGAGLDETEARVLGPLEKLGWLVEHEKPARIIVAQGERRGRMPVADLLDAELAGIQVEDGIEIYERLTQKLAIEAIRPSALIFSRIFRKSRVQTGASRAVSVFVAAVGLVVTAPLMLLVAAAIKLESRGPVLFVHERVGLYGRRFNLLKFRTMDEAAGPRSEWVRDNADRITRVGKWLRKFRLDELPQFVNILRGDMNLVGPRPHPVSNYALFVERIPYYTLRSVVRPGVTGWAQIRYGYANDLAEETEKMRFDLYYIKHLSLWFDLRIISDTVKTVCLGRGARTTDAYPVEPAQNGGTR